MREKLLYPRSTIRRVPPLNCANPDEAPSFLRSEETCPACYLRALRRVYVSPAGVVFKWGRVVPESVYSLSASRVNARTFYKKALLGKVRHVRGRCAVVHNPYYGSYYHWLLEALPRAFCIREQAHDLTLLLGNEERSFHLPTLQFFGFKDIVRIPRDELARTDELLLPGQIGPYAVHNHEAIAAMAPWMVERTTWDGKEFAGYERVYIRRGADKVRRVVNEDDVIAELEHYGFRTVILEDLTIPQQINLFRNVRSLVALHGAGVSNMIFMRPGGLIVTFINEWHRDAVYYNLAAPFGHRLAIMQCRTHGAMDRDVKKYDMIVNVANLRHCLGANLC
jgi:hypothetical protein